MRVTYSPRALAQLEAIFTYIAEVNPRAARAAVDHIEATENLLGAFPWISAKYAYFVCCTALRIASNTNSLDPHPVMPGLVRASAPSLCFSKTKTVPVRAWKSGA
jgi:hypothetical protein